MRIRGGRCIHLVSLAIAAVAGCAGDKSEKAGTAETYAVDLRVGTDGIEILDVEAMPTGRVPHHAQALTPLEYRLLDRDGNEVIRARMPDFRWARSEAMDPESGHLSAAEFRLPSAIGSIRLPAIAGELVILEPTDGGLVELGRAPYDPTP